jgi:hypothetical protein
MALFEPALQTALLDDGGYINDPDNRAGDTYKGATRNIFSKLDGCQIVDSLKQQCGFPSRLDKHADLKNKANDVFKTNFVGRIRGDQNTDSGTSCLALANYVFDSIPLNNLNHALVQKIKKASNNSISVSGPDRAKRPNIKFTFPSETEDVPPQTDWQTNYPDLGEAVFQIAGGEVQSIFGLLLLNNYYTVFDRLSDKNGIIKFAPKFLDNGTSRKSEEE